MEGGHGDGVANAPRLQRRRSVRGEQTVLWLLLTCVLLASSAYGVLLLGPFVKTVGGSEATYGALSAAAAVPTAAALALLLRFPRAVPPQLLMAGACLVYAGAAALMAGVHSRNGALVVAAIVLGTAWAVTYTAAPMIASELATDRNRATLIGYATGTIQAGFGIGPVLGNALRDAGMSYQQVLAVGAALALAAAVLVVPLTIKLRRLAAGQAAGAQSDAAEEKPRPQPVREPEHPGRAAGTGWRGALRSPRVVPLAMVLLSACVFTTMNSFQTTFADSRQLDFDIFYVTYTVAVIAVRLGLARMLPDSASDRVVAVTTVGMTAAAVAFVFVGTSPVLYCLGLAAARLHLRPGPARLPGPRGEPRRPRGTRADAADGGPAVRGCDPRLSARRRGGRPRERLPGAVRAAHRDHRCRHGAWPDSRSASARRAAGGGRRQRGRRRGRCCGGRGLSRRSIERLNQPRPAPTTAQGGRCTSPRTTVRRESVFSPRPAIVARISSRSRSGSCGGPGVSR
ncbi:MFS transporter [Candidatus Frankia alpina]|uniref:MFS transporter n=1 Tax=Candidatus Frankia alpina TaxID=2699483 RepID=A0A4S5DZQ0_9ACTN|nr:MFS transporter [Candidatus Frankia alpina]